MHSSQHACNPTDVAILGSLRPALAVGSHLYRRHCYLPFRCHLSPWPDHRDGTYTKRTQSMEIAESTTVRHASFDVVSNCHCKLTRTAAMLMEPIGHRQAVAPIVPPTSDSASPSPYHTRYNLIDSQPENPWKLASVPTPDA